VLEEENAAIIA